MLPLVVRALAKCKSNHKSARKDEDRDVVCGLHLQNHSFIGGVLLIASHFHLLSVPFAQQQVKLIHNQCCFLPGQVDIPEVGLTWSYIVMIMCSLYFFEQFYICVCVCVYIYI